MFYNNYRTTKSSIREAEQNKLAGVGQSIINHRERLLNLQKRQKLKDLLITKFMQKYGIKNPEEILEDEITKFLQGEKLTDADLKRLDEKVKQILKENAAKENLKNSLTKSLQGNTLNQGLSLNNQNLNTMGDQLDNNMSKRGNSQQKILPTEPGINTLQQPNLSSSSYKPLQTYGSVSRSYNKIYKKPEEELAELEAEFAEEEKKKQNKYERIDFSDQGDEWAAMAKYNRKVYEDQIKEERIKDNELKRRNMEDLDLQIKQKLRREYEDELKEKEYDKILEEHQKKMDEEERKRQELIKQQIQKERESREAQMKADYVRKRINFLKDKKFEKSLVKTIQEGIEKEKKEAIEKKRRENEALINAIKENEIKIKKKKEEQEKQKQEDVKMAEERIKMEMKEDIARNRYYESIRKYGNKYVAKQADEIIEKQKKEQEEEDRKMQFYFEEKNRLANERERQEEIRRQNERKELKKYLDMQIEEKRKEEEFLKSLDDEQARIWAIDCKKYNEDEKAIEQKIRAMNKRNLDLVMEQMKQKKKKNNNTMTDAEYAMNRETLQKARDTLNK